VRGLQASVEQVLLATFAPPAVVVSTSGDILYINGNIEPYLELPAGRANWNLFAMARDGLRSVVAPALNDVVAHRTKRVLRDTLIDRNGEVRAVDVVVEPLADTTPLRGCFLVAFRESDVAVSPPPREARGDAEDARDLELEQARNDLVEMRRAMQTSEEELRAINEELQSTNEEVQSTNEELTTSKEETQSMNEELQTLNSELHDKLAELSRAGNDMKNLLDSTEIAVLFLDDALRVRRYTPKATLLFKLLPVDIGRPLADLASSLLYPELYDEARAVLTTLVPKDARVSASEGRDVRVRIMPYRTSDNRADGLVMTFNIISREPGTPGTIS
jgi:two-component system, chemotaxis family, CheB/CheR fusion protein